MDSRGRCCSNGSRSFMDVFLIWKLIESNITAVNPADHCLYCLWWRYAFCLTYFEIFWLNKENTHSEADPWKYCPDRQASHIMYMIAQMLSFIIQRLQLQKQIKKGWKLFSKEVWGKKVRKKGCFIHKHPIVLLQTITDMYVLSFFTFKVCELISNSIHFYKPHSWVMILHHR